MNRRAILTGLSFPAFFWVVSSILIPGFVLSLHADDTRCDPAVDSCKSSRAGYLMVCACLDGASKDLNFRGFDLRQALFQKEHAQSNIPDLSGADLSGANISESAALKNTILSGTHLEGSRLEGADLSGTTGFTTAKLNGATFDSETVLPLPLPEGPDSSNRNRSRQFGCSFGMIWQDHNPETGLPENCDGALVAAPETPSPAPNPAQSPLLHAPSGTWNGKICGDDSNEQCQPISAQAF